MNRAIEKNRTIDRLSKWATLDLIQFRTINAKINVSEGRYEEDHGNIWKYCNKRK